jgi:cytochrome c oxidase cbb3-type subunit 3
MQLPAGPAPERSLQPIPATNPFASDTSAAGDGRNLFVQYNCYGCHGGRAGGGMGPSLRDADWIYGGSDANIYASIWQGRPKGMPAWGLRLPDKQVWQLVAYIRSLDTPAEPARPLE